MVRSRSRVRIRSRPISVLPVKKSALMLGACCSAFSLLAPICMAFHGPTTPRTCEVENQFNAPSRHKRTTSNRVVFPSDNRGGTGNPRQTEHSPISAKRAGLDGTTTRASRSPRPRQISSDRGGTAPEPGIGMHCFVLSYPCIWVLQRARHTGKPLPGVSEGKVRRRVTRQLLRPWLPFRPACRTPLE